MSALVDEILTAASKEALVRVLKQQCWVDRLLFDVVTAEWHVRSERAQAAMAAASEEGKRLSGGQSMDRHIKWLQAQKRFDAAMKAGDAAWGWSERMHAKVIAAEQVAQGERLRNQWDAQCAPTSAPPEVAP